MHDKVSRKARYGSNQHSTQLSLQSSVSVAHVDTGYIRETTRSVAKNIGNIEASSCLHRSVNTEQHLLLRGDVSCSGVSCTSEPS